MASNACGYEVFPVVKRRHKPISDSGIVTLADQQAQKKVGAKQRLLKNAYRARCSAYRVAGNC
jgi:hypothetical protein